jgi:hypothetical protein
LNRAVQVYRHIGLRIGPVELTRTPREKSYPFFIISFSVLTDLIPRRLSAGENPKPYRVLVHFLERAADNEKPTARRDPQRNPTILRLAVRRIEYPHCAWVPEDRRRLRETHAMLPLIRIRLVRVPPEIAVHQITPEWHLLSTTWPLR